MRRTQDRTGIQTLELGTSLFLSICGKLRACQQLISHPESTSFLARAGDPEKDLSWVLVSGGHKPRLASVIDTSPSPYKQTPSSLLLPGPSLGQLVVLEASGLFLFWWIPQRRSETHFYRHPKVDVVTWNKGKYWLQEENLHPCHDFSGLASLYSHPCGDTPRIEAFTLPCLVLWGFLASSVW